MGRGRPPKPGTVEEKKAARREQVRNNVRALRERRKHKVNAREPITCRTSNQLKCPEASCSFVISHEKNVERSLEHEERKGSTYPTPAVAIVLHSVDEEVERRLQLPVQVNTKNLYAIALLATFRKMFLPEATCAPSDVQNLTRRPWDDQQLLWTPCAFWVTSSFANAKSQENSLIRTSLLSIGLLLKGLENDEVRLREAAIEMYRRALKGIRSRLDRIVQGKPQGQNEVITLYQSCHAAALFELIENTDINATQRHLQGVCQLICHMAETFDEEGQAKAWSLLQDYRFAEMGVCLKLRYKSYSSIAKRKFEEIISSHRNCRSLSPDSTPPRGCSSNGLTILLADLADDISFVMLRYDIIQLSSTACNTRTELEYCLADLEKTWQKFPLIQAQLLENYRETLICTSSEKYGTTMSSYSFKRYDVGTAWCSSLMAQLYCLETFVEIITLLMEVQAGTRPRMPTDSSRACGIHDSKRYAVDNHALAERLCEYRTLHRAKCIQLSRCLPHFWKMNKGVSGQALAIYPLDAALTMLTKELQRLKVDLCVAQLTGKKDHIDVVMGDIAEISNVRESVHQMQTQGKQFGIQSLNVGG